MNEPAQERLSDWTHSNRTCAEWSPRSGAEAPSVIDHVVVLPGGTGIKESRAIADRLATIKPDEQRVLLATVRSIGEGFDASCILWLRVSRIPAPELWTCASALSRTTTVSIVTIVTSDCSVSLHPVISNCHIGKSTNSMTIHTRTMGTISGKASGCAGFLEWWRLAETVPLSVEASSRRCGIR